MPNAPRLQIKHKSGITARAVEENGDFIVLSGSETRKDTDHLLGNYGELSADLIKQGVMVIGDKRRSIHLNESVAVQKPFCCSHNRSAEKRERSERMEARR